MPSLLSPGYAPAPVYQPPLAAEPVPPPEQYVEPAPAPVAQEQAAPPPQEAAPPPQEQTAPAGFTPLGGGAASAPATPQDQPVTQPAAQPAPSTGSATDAVGATVGGWRDLPAKVVEDVRGGAIQNAVSEFTGIGKDHERVYQPAPADVPGETIEGAGARTSESIEGFMATEDTGLAGIPNVLGAIKDMAVSKLGEQGGEVSPERANQTRWETERLKDELETGDPFASKPDADGRERAQWDIPLYSQNDYADWARENPELFQRALNEGYTTPEGYVFGPGLDAPWEVFQSGRSGVERAVADIGMSPGSFVADAAATLIGGAGMAVKTLGKEAAKRGTGRAVMGMAPETAQKVGTAGQVVGRGIDVVGTMGLSEVVPAGFTVLGKGYNAIPWVGKQTARSAAEEVADTGQQAVGEAIAQSRAAGGPVTAPRSAITQPTPDPQIQRVALPAQNGSGPLELTYHLNRKGKLDGVYDTAVPAPGERYRPLTPADSQTIYDAWGRLADPDRQTLRRAAFPRMSRVQTSPGEPFIEHAAERITDPATGAMLADTGRMGTGYQREVDDLRRTITTSRRPDQIITDFTSSWKKTLYDGKLHPLTRRSQAEHRLQTLRDVVDALPASHKTPEIQRHLREMAALLPKTPPKDMFDAAYKWRGPTTGTGGGLIPVAPREAAWLREMAALPTKAFNRKALDAGRVGKKGGLIFDRKPPPTAPDAFQNGYANYQTLMDFRLKNPPSGRFDLANLKGELRAGRGSLAPASVSREDAIKDALERTGIVPGASAMPADQVIAEIDAFLRRTKPTFPTLPGANSGIPASIFPPGSQDELWGIGLDDALRDTLDTQLDVNGTSRTLGQRGFTHWEETATAHEIAKLQAAGRPIDPADAKALSTQLSRITSRFPGEYGKLTATQLAKMEPGEIDRLASSLLKADIQQSQGLRGVSGKMLTPAEKSGLLGKGITAYDEFIAKWRSVVLYNVARGIQYPMLQAAGNLLTPIIAGNLRVVPFYLNPKQWPRRVKYLRNPETATPPSIIDHLDRVGLPRDPNLGRVSKDQLGARTGFNREDSWGITKALGTVLGNQRIKDLADSIDTGLRQSAFESIWEPGYSRLKKDLVPMTQQRMHAIAAARGVPLNVSRGQIDTAIKQVEAANGGYFNQTQLREALFEAFGGNNAANRNELMGVARRTAEDYHSELKELRTLSNIEVDRLAFQGSETNLDAALQRTFMFTWWIKNATRLYATSAAGSPVQMALWARALESENQRVREGANPRFKSMVEFLKTPAGYTVSLNPMSLLGTYLLGTSADPASPTANLTALGQFFGGGPFGENLILSPLLQAAGQAIGAFGQDYRNPDVLGTGRIEREIVDALNYVNQHWVQFHSTPGGAPERIPMPGFGPGMVNFLAQHISGLIPGTQKVAGYDPTAPAEGRMSALIAEQVLRDNPELDPNDEYDAEILRRGITLAMDDPDSAHYQEALSRDVDGQYLGLGSTGEGGWRDVVGAVASHFVLPTSFSRQPTYRTDVLAEKGRDKLRDDGSTTLTPEGEIDPYEKMLGTVGARSPEGRAVELIRDAVKGDPQTMAVKDLSEGIRYADLGKLPPEGIDIEGIHYSPEDLAAIEDPEILKDLANDWIKAAGYRPILDQYYANKTAHMESNRAYADGEGLPDYAKQYPGGVDRFVDDTAAINPNYKAFIEGNVVSEGQLKSLPEMRVTDHAQWEAHVTAYDDAKNTIAGIKDSRYGLEIDPAYAGTVAGLSEPVGAWKVRTDAEEQAAFLADNPWIEPDVPIDPIGVVGPANPGPDGGGSTEWAAPTAAAPASTPWYEQAANAVGDVFDGFARGVSNQPLQGTGGPERDPLANDPNAYGLPEMAAGVGQALGAAKDAVLDGLRGSSPAPLAPVEQPFKVSGIDTTTYVSPNRSVRPAPPGGIVYHYTVGELDSFIGEFMGATNRASSNYVVDRDGTIYQLVDPDDAAWTHGDTNNPRTDLPWLTEQLGLYGDMNMSAIGIEIVNSGDLNGEFEPYTEEQVAALEYLTAYLTDRYDIPASRDRLLAHSDINTIDKRDPGPMFPWDAVMAAAA